MKERFLKTSQTTKILDESNAEDLEDLVEDESVDVNAEGVVGEEEDAEDVVEGQENELDDLGDVDDLHVTEKAEGKDLEVDEEALGVVEDGETKAHGELALALYLTTKEAILTPTGGTRLFVLRMDSDNTQ